MPIIQPPPVSKQLQDEIHKAELMYDFITETIPDKFIGDTDQKILIAAIYSLTSEHHAAILHLLKAGRFGSVGKFQCFTMSGRSYTINSLMYSRRDAECRGNRLMPDQQGVLSDVDEHFFLGHLQSVQAANA
jgi:hypothetical protein